VVLIGEEACVGLCEGLCVVSGWGRDGIDVSGSVRRVQSGVIDVSGGFGMDAS